MRKSFSLISFFISLQRDHSFGMVPVIFSRPDRNGCSQTEQNKGDYG